MSGKWDRCPSYFYDDDGAPWHCRGDRGHGPGWTVDRAYHYCGDHNWSDAEGEPKR